MSKALLLKRSPLSYPGGNPGFDPSHALSKNAIFSGVSLGANFVNLLSGSAGTIIGTPSANLTNLGMVTKFGSTGTDRLSWSVASAAGDFTGAAIFNYGAAAGSSQGLIETASGGTTANINGISLNSNGNNNPEIIVGATFSFLIPGILVPGVDYFYVASWSQSLQKVNYLLANLNNGTVKSGTISLTATSASGTSVNVGNHGSVGRPLGGNGVAATYLCGQFLSPPQLRQWAQDPWGFWYP